MRIYDLRTADMINPLGIEVKEPEFSWKLASDKKDVHQLSYNIKVATDKAFNELVWDSGIVESDNSINVKYAGNPLTACTRYYWKVSVETNHEEKVTSEDSDEINWFETGMFADWQQDMSSEDIIDNVWNGAKWIGSTETLVNTDGVSVYEISADYQVEKGNKAGFVLAARNRDNYVLIEIDMDNRIIKGYEYSDEAWVDGIPKISPLGNKEGYAVSGEAVKQGEEYNLQHIVINVNKDVLSISINGVSVIADAEKFMPENIVNKPRKQYMMLIGFKQNNSKAIYENVSFKAGECQGTIETGVINYILRKNNEYNVECPISSFNAEFVSGRLTVEKDFLLLSPSPTVNVRKAFATEKNVTSARLYSSALGFYDVYINGAKINEEFYNPGFTDYRKRIFYQTYDVTEHIRKGRNVIGATVAKGYYTGFVGYSFLPMVYGRENAFLGKLVINYDDGSEDIIVTDKTWQYTGLGSVIVSDFQQGEICDARFDFDWEDEKDIRWNACGIKQLPKEVIPTNGTISGVKFELNAQLGPGAKLERVLTPVSQPCEMPKGHFVYDFGQNMVGTVRINLKGKRGTALKFRYGEMCYKDGSVYIANLRTAANTDVYVLKGDEQGETFLPSFTGHGFRYMEVTGDGYELNAEQFKALQISVQGLVITNTTENTGEFECSNQLINKLQSNIQWGQRGNSLLVYTDCPQRNERMGWTGDAQVFAATAAYNMNVKTFMNKWLVDVQDGQLLYNRDGAVPDTAPLGGDNRKMGGCAGWGDAAVIVPWEMYQAYGDISVLEDNYDMMKRWVDYQSLDYRQFNGMRIVNGAEVLEQSDLSSENYIQVQQSRGDHLTFDESTPFILSATAYAAYVAKLLYKTAEILGHDEDASKYRIRYENVKKAFNEAWVQEDGSLAYWGEMSKSNTDNNGNVINQTYYSNKEGSNSIPSQTAYALAIDFELIPEDKLNRAAECLMEAIKERDGKLSVGFLGISHLAPALTKAGCLDVAFSLLEQEENPSWLYSIKNGATTIWERWNSYISETDTFGDVNMNSFNHYAYGAIGEWMYKNILGINSSNIAGETGYKCILLTPTPGGNLTYAKGSYDTVYGTIKSEWKLDNGKFKYACEIPVNTRATLHLPSKNGRVLQLLGSGCYEFETEIE